ncbi:MAG: glycosyltransferase [Phycisphaerae bacterium]
MRIWLLTSELPHEYAGGIARYVDNFARALGQGGHEVVILARTAQPCDREIAPGVRVIGVVPRTEQPLTAEPPDEPTAHPHYPYTILGYWPALAFQMAEQTLALLDELPAPDVIEAQEFCAPAYYLLQRRLTERTPLDNVPIVVNLHSAQFDLLRINQSPRYRFPEYWVGRMERFCLAAADALICPSYFLARHIREEYEPDLDIRTLHLPFVADYDRPPAEGQPGELVYVGRLEWRKGVLGLVKACAALWESGREFHLTLIGGDTEFAPTGCSIGTLLRQRYDKWIDRDFLRLCGAVPHNEVADLVRNAWAALVPSHWENFPNTCIEAMAAGQLPLVSRQGGQAEMVAEDGVNGFIFDWNVPGDLEAKLTHVLDLDPQERLTIVKRAQQRIRGLCDPDIVVPQRLRHFEEVIARHQPRTRFPAAAPPRHAQSPADTQTPTVVVPRVAENEQPGLLSVVIPFYNLAEYIDETLANVLASRYSPLEVVLVNDGSTADDAREKLAEIEARGLPNVRVLHTDNQGLASARNNGVEAARGEFVALVDADDLIEPDFCARAIDVLRRYENVAFVYSWVRWFDSANAIWPTWNAEFPYLLGHNMTCVLSVVRRAAFRSVGGNDPSFAYAMEDYACWVGMLAAGYVGVSLPYPGVRYRIRPNSMLRCMNDNQALYLFDLLTEHYPDAYRRWGTELFNLQNANGPGRLWNHPALDTGPAGVAAQGLREAHDWLTDQWRAHQARVVEQDQIITELRGWTDELVTAKGWLTERWEQSQDEVTRQQSIATELRDWAQKLEQRVAELTRELESARGDGGLARASDRLRRLLRRAGLLRSSPRK